jgi:hypothetical protein
MECGERFLERVPLNFAKVVRHFAKFSHYLRVAEIAIAGSPVRLKATAPTFPGLRESASARVTTAVGLKHSTASPGATPSSTAMNGNATK